jgi:hypothetical protein
VFRRHVVDQPVTRPARPAWVVPAAYAWVAGFALIHVLAIVSNGAYGAGVDPGAADSGLRCVIPNAIVIMLCAVGAGVLHRTTDPRRPLVPAWTVSAGARIGMPLLVVRGVSAAIDNILRQTGVMPYGIFDQDENATSAWAQWSGLGIDLYFMVGAAVFVLALGPWLRKRPAGEALHAQR